MAAIWERLKDLVPRLFASDRTWVRVIEVGAALVTVLAFVISMTVVAVSWAWPDDDAEESSPPTSSTDEPGPDDPEDDPDDPSTTDTSGEGTTTTDSGGGGGPEEESSNVNFNVQAPGGQWGWIPDTYFVRDQSGRLGLPLC